MPVQDRISFLNLSTNTINTLDIMNNEEVIKVLYEFIKTKITVLDLSKFIPNEDDLEKFKKAVSDVQIEVQKNKNKKDFKIQKLEDMLKKIFEKLEMFEFDTIDDLTEELRKAYEEAKAINDENERLSATYGGSFAFVKTISDSVIETNVDRSDIEKLLLKVYLFVKDKINDDALILQGKNGFIDNVKSSITIDLIAEGIYTKIRNNYDEILELLYTNLLLYKECI